MFLIGEADREPTSLDTENNDHQGRKQNLPICFHQVVNDFVERIKMRFPFIIPDEEQILGFLDYTVCLSPIIQVLENRCQNQPRHLLYNHITKDRNGRHHYTKASPVVDLISTAKKRELKQYVHLIRTDNLSTAILQDITLGKRRKKLTDNVTNWTGKSFTETQTFTSNRGI